MATLIRSSCQIYNSDLKVYSNFIIVIDSNKNVIEVYDESDPNMTNILLDTKDAVLTTIVSIDPITNISYPVYSYNGILFDNVYDEKWTSFDDYGIVITTMGNSVDSYYRGLYGVPNNNPIYYNIVNSNGDPETDRYIYALLWNEPNTSDTKGYTYPVTLSSFGISCFTENTIIFTEDGYVPIEDLVPGTYLPTFSSGVKKVEIVGKRSVVGTEHEKVILYNYPNTGLTITGKHSILVDSLSSIQKEKIPGVIGSLKQTDGKWLLPACLDDRCVTLQRLGCVSLYHIVLENENDCDNYGILANGQWVESCSKYDFDNYSKMNQINRNVKTD
jgi:hypothetical protein